MISVLKNVLALLAGFIVGATVNMGLVFLGPYVIPYPEGYDHTTAEGIRAGVPLLEVKHYIMPFLSHALGTLAGAFMAAKIAADRKKAYALIIGFIFMMGGIAMIRQVGGPLWFKILDLGFAYVPMAILGYYLAGGEGRMKRGV